MAAPLRSPMVFKTSPFSDTYDLTNKTLGQGLAGKVEEVQHRATKQLYAMKVLPASPKARLEAELHSRCSGSPFVVTVIEVYENTYRGQHSLLLIMEHMSGGELFDRIKDAGDMGFCEKEAREIVLQITRAIAYLHSAGITHRDLKPENILFSDSSPTAQLKLTDFGFAKYSGNALTTPVYTPYYVAPEVLNVRSQTRTSYDKSCDIWSLGVVVYIILAGYPPFYSYSQQQTALSPGMEERIRLGEYDFDDEVWDGVSIEAQDLVMKLLQTRPEDRPSAEEVLRHPWLLTARDSLPSTPLKLPGTLSQDGALWTDAKEELSSALTSMRISDHICSLKPLSTSGSQLLAKRRTET
eukprot:m.38160 g.38160  ORF g.38160 m.38160 type:complete len:354 (+) comp5871_c0_seq2:332-1393(+)